MYEIIDRKPTIDASRPGTILDDVSSFVSLWTILSFDIHFDANFDLLTSVLMQLEGDIELDDVSFTYPARPDRQVFSNFSLTIPAGN